MIPEPLEGLGVPAPEVSRETPPEEDPRDGLGRATLGAPVDLEGQGELL